MTLPIEFKFFYRTPNDNNFYHVTCRMFLQDYLETSDSVSWDDDDNNDYEFFFQSLNDSGKIFHITCKLLSHSLILNILNKEIYGMEFDVNDLKRRYFLTLHQKLSLERNLKQILPLYFSIPDDREARDSNEILNSSHENIDNTMSTQSYSTVDNQNVL